MSLDPSYLEYPKRRLGMDHDLYAYSNLFERPPVAWPSGAKVAAGVVVSLEWFPIIPSDTPFRAPGHMQTAYPDFRHYTAREYGTRVGFFRLLDAFEARGITATIAANSAIAERYPSIIADIVAAGHEIVAHSTDMNGTIASGLDEADERALIATSLDTLERVSGTRPSGWMSIARSESFNTPRLLAEAGVRYLADWVNDDLPYAMTTEGGPIWSVPVNHELSDRWVISTQAKSPDSYAEQILDARTWLVREAGRFGGRFLPIHVTPYIIGLPYRIAAFEALLDALVADDDVSFETLGAVVEAAEECGDVPNV
ncbi:MAG: polysaccharide deacetylase family protein [Actinobacteria bacterium]|nr:polysaccharide deacetylase family protein [Actinomycetota bacterium]